jgi:Fe-S-cluster containining protein
VLSGTLPPEVGIYQLLADCGNLGANYQCLIYENRPNACRNFLVGSVACAEARNIYRDEILSETKPEVSQINDEFLHAYS